MNVLTNTIGLAVLTSWLVSMTTFLLWRRMVYREPSLLGVSVGTFFLSLSFVLQLLLVQDPSGFLGALNVIAMVIGLTMLLWATVRLIAPGRFASRQLPWLTGVYGLGLSFALFGFAPTAPLSMGIFSWAYATPLCFVIAILYTFGYSQSVLVDSFRRSRAAILLTLTWFILGFAYATMYWLFETPRMPFFYAAVAFAFSLHLLGLALMTRHESFRKHRQVREPEHFTVEGEEWQVKFF